MSDQELAFATILELSQMIRQRKLSPVELTEFFLGRIDKLNGRLNAFLTITGDAALNAAKAAEDSLSRGDELGPLHGIPMGVKDLDSTKDVRTTSGSLIFKDTIPTKNQTNVERMLQAGAIMLGKTNTPEFGFLGATENRLGDPCGNPWNPGTTPGGSSGGSAAAVASGMVPVGTGGDGGGSIRIPASFCGIYGIKPTQGRVPLGNPGLPDLPNQLGQLGGLTRTVSDSALVLQIVAGHDSIDPIASRVPPPDFSAAVNRGVKGLRIAWSPDYGYANVDPEVVDIAEKGARLFEDLGCSVEETNFTLTEPFERAFWPIFSANGYAAHRSDLENHAEDLSWYVRECLEYGATVTGEQYAQALGYVDRLKGQLADLLETYDLLLSPTMAIPAFPHGNPPNKIGGNTVKRPYWDFLPFTFPINMAGHPAASVPSGFSKDGLPIGLHIVGRRWDEETVLAASGAFEEAQPWAHLKPPVS